MATRNQSYVLEMPLMCLFNIVPKYLNEVWSKRLEYKLNYNINGTTTILCSRAGVLIFIKRIPIFAFHSLMQFSKVPYKMSSCLVDNCRWLYLRNLLPFYLDLWPTVGLPYRKPQQRFAVHTTSQRWATWLLSSPAWMFASKKLSLWCS